MLVKMMRWRSWPPLISRKYEVRLTVHRLEGDDRVREGAEKDSGGLAVEIRWKCPKITLGSFRRTVKRNCTREVVKRVEDGPNGGVLVEWNEEFHGVCSLSGFLEAANWQALNEGAKHRIRIVGSAVLNLAEYASKNEEQEIEVKIPLTVSSVASEGCPFFCRLTIQSPIMPVPSPLSDGPTSSTEKDEVSAFIAGLRKVKTFSEYVSTGRSKKGCQGTRPRARKTNLRTLSIWTRKMNLRTENVMEARRNLLVGSRLVMGRWLMLIVRTCCIIMALVSVILYKTEEDSKTSRLSVSEFGDDSFAVSTWEQKEITSRDGHMKIQTHVFSASTDQRSEQAAGESARTALVAVIRQSDFKKGLAIHHRLQIEFHFAELQELPKGRVIFK